MPFAQVPRLLYGRAKARLAFIRLRTGAPRPVLPSVGGNKHYQLPSPRISREHTVPAVTEGRAIEEPLASGL